MKSKLRKIYGDGPLGRQKTSDEIRALVFRPLRDSPEAKTIIEDFFLALRFNTARDPEPDLNYMEKLHVLFGVKHRSVSLYKAREAFEIGGKVVKQADPKLSRKVPSRKLEKNFVLIVREDFRNPNVIDVQVLPTFLDEDDSGWFRLTPRQWLAARPHVRRLSKEEVYEDATNANRR